MSISYDIKKSTVSYKKDEKRNSNKAADRIFSLTRDVVCYNQGMIAEYYFLHNNFQEKLKNLLRKIYQLKNSKEINKTQFNTLVQETINIFDQYDEKKSRILNEIIKKNLSFVDNYFSKRSLYDIRCCIKILDSDKQVIDPFRNKKSKYKYNKNTGFKILIEDEQKEYLCNNIPEYVATGSYENIRINKQCVEKYYRKHKEKNIIITTFTNIFYPNNKQNIDEDWIQCWKSYDNKKSPNMKDCYKSTLIIPMTFRNNSLSDNHIDYINQSGKENKNSLLGFLCVDHVEINYFKKQNDVNFCYKIADLVSLYILKDATDLNNDLYKAAETFVDKMRNIQESDRISMFNNSKIEFQ